MARRNLGQSIAKKAASVLVGGVKNLAASFIAAILPVVIPALLAIAGVSLAVSVINGILDYFTDKKSENFLYTEYDSTGKISESTEAQSYSLENELSALYYKKYSDTGYYFTIDNDNTLIQKTLGDYYTSTGILVEDVHGRESMFTLNSSMIMILDQNLNTTYSYPAQFIKPVYNTCSQSGSTDTVCKTLSLTDENGNLIVNSQKMTQTAYKVEDDKPGDIDDNYSGYIYSPVNGESEPGVYDYGLAPIFHYSSYIEKERVVDYHIEEVEVLKVDEDGNPIIVNGQRVYEKVDFDSLSSALLETYNDIFKPEKFNNITLEYGNPEAEKNSVGISSPAQRYAIDNVASYFGNIDYPFTVDYITVGPFDVIEAAEKKMTYTYPTIESDLSNPDYKKQYRHYSGDVVVWRERDLLTPEEKKYCDDKLKLAEEAYNACKELYKLDENGPSTEDATTLTGYDCSAEKEAYEAAQDTMSCYNDRRAPAAWVFDGTALEYGTDGSSDYLSEESIESWKKTILSEMKSTWSRNLYYYKTGTLERIAPIYSQTISTDGLTGTSYLEDYINNYKAYMPIQSGDPTEVVYDCYKPNVLETNLAYSEMDFAFVYETSRTDIGDENLKTLEQIKNGSQIVSTVTDVGLCPNNTIAISRTPGVLNSLNMNDFPTLQYVLIAENFGYTIKEDADTGNLVLTNLPIPYVATKGIGTNKTAFNTVMAYTLPDGRKLMDIIYSVSATYGIDANILIAIIADATNGDVASATAEEGCWYTREGCGITGFHISQDAYPTIYSGWNFSSRELERIVVDEYTGALGFGQIQYRINKNNLSNIETNLKITAIYLSSLFSMYEQNIPMMLQAYSSGVDEMDLLLEDYKEKTGIKRSESMQDDRQLNWLTSNGVVTYGEKEYLANIFSQFGLNNSAFTIKYKGLFGNSDYVNFSFLDYKDKTEWDQKSEKENTMEKTINRKLKSIGYSNIESLWPLFFANQVNFNDNIYDAQNNIIVNQPYNVLIDGENKKGSAENIIKQIFAFQEGVSISEFNNLTEAEWNKKIANLLQSASSASWSFVYDLELLFPMGFEYIYPTETFNVIGEAGYYTNASNKREYRTYSLVASKPGEDVVTMGKGIVVDLKEKSDNFGKYVTVSYHDANGKGSMITYADLGQINVSIGQELNPGEVIGKLPSTNGVYRIQVETPEGYENIGIIANTLEIVEQYREALNSYSYTAGKQNKVVLQQLKSMLSDGEFDNWSSSTTLSNPLVQASEHVRLTYGSWTYTTSPNSTAHSGADIGTSGDRNTPIIVPTDAVITHYNDEHKDKVIGDPVTSADYQTNNKIGYLIDINGMIYQINVSHIKQNSVTEAAKGIIVSAGTQIATVGNSGYSKGYHGHIEVRRIGKMTMAEAIALYGEPNWSELLNSNSNGKKCDQNGGIAPCHERPECMFGYDPNNTSGLSKQVWQIGYASSAQARSCSGYPLASEYSSIVE